MHRRCLALPRACSPQVAERGESEVRCVAANTAYLDGLLNVLPCHTGELGFLEGCLLASRGAGQSSERA